MSATGDRARKTLEEYAASRPLRAMVELAQEKPQMAYKRYCVICGVPFMSEWGLEVTCGEGCAQVLENEMREGLQGQISALVPEAIAVLEEIVAADALRDQRIGPRECVYLIQSGDDGPIKIGYTQNLSKRIGALQTGHPYPLSVLATLQGGLELEAELHQRFADARLTGEWFEPTSELLFLAREEGIR